MIHPGVELVALNSGNYGIADETTHPGLGGGSGHLAAPQLLTPTNARRLPCGLRRIPERIRR